MSGQLPILSGKQVRAAFEKVGWEYVRQRGSHMILVKDQSIVTLSVPNHKEVARGTLRGLLRAADMTVGEFLNLL